MPLALHSRPFTSRGSSPALIPTPSTLPRSDGDHTLQGCHPQTACANFARSTPVFRSARTTVRSALASSLFNWSPTLAPPQVPAWIIGRQCFPRSPSSTACDASRLRSTTLHALTLAGFPRTEIPKRLAYWLCASSPPDYLRSAQALASHVLPKRDLMCRDYRLELYKDPRRLRNVVPDAPGFPLRPCCVSTASPAHLSGARSTIARRPRRGFAPLRSTAGFTQLPALPCPCRPIPPGIRSKGTLQSPAPVVAWRARLGAPRFSRASLWLGEPQGLAWQCWVAAHRCAVSRTHGWTAAQATVGGRQPAWQFQRALWPARTRPHYGA